MKKTELIKEVLNSMRHDICGYEAFLFDLAEVGLKNWTVKELRGFLGLDE